MQIIEKKRSTDIHDEQHSEAAMQPRHGSKLLLSLSSIEAGVAERSDFTLPSGCGGRVLRFSYKEGGTPRAKLHCS